MDNLKRFFSNYIDAQLKIKLGMILRVDSFAKAIISNAVV